MSDDARLYSPSAARNRGPILDVLHGEMPVAGTVLEIASGTGEHVAHLAAALPTLDWQPSDLDPDHRASINAWTAGLANVRPAIALDAAAAWPNEPVDVVLCINMIHIAPWTATLGLIAGAAGILTLGGLLALYGPYRRAGVPMEPGNAAFDADLRRRNPAWGLRELEAVAALAAAAGFGLPTVIAMPADNRMVLLRRLD